MLRGPPIFGQCQIDFELSMWSADHPKWFSYQTLRSSCKRLSQFAIESRSWKSLLIVTFRLVSSWICSSNGLNLRLWGLNSRWNAVHMLTTKGFGVCCSLQHCQTPSDALSGVLQSSEDSLQSVLSNLILLELNFNLLIDSRFSALLVWGIRWMLHFIAKLEH